MVKIFDDFAKTTTFVSLGIGAPFIVRNDSTVMHFIKVSLDLAYDLDDEELTEFNNGEVVEPHDIEITFM